MCGMCAGFAHIAQLTPGTPPPLHSLPSPLPLQDPFLFKGTVRRNLDPLGEHKEEALWRALEQVWEEPWERGKVAWEGRLDAL